MQCLGSCLAITGSCPGSLCRNKAPSHQCTHGSSNMLHITPSIPTDDNCRWRNGPRLCSCQMSRRTWTSTWVSGTTERVWRRGRRVATRRRSSTGPLQALLQLQATAKSWRNPAIMGPLNLFSNGSYPELGHGSGRDAGAACSGKDAD